MTKRIFPFILISSLFIAAGCHKKAQPEQTEETSVKQAIEQNSEAALENAQAESEPVPQVVPAEVEDAALSLFDDTNEHYDYQKGCEELRKLEEYTKPILEFRRGRCDLLKGQAAQDDALYQAGLARIRKAADQECEDALVFLSESGLDLDLKAHFALKAYYKKQAEADKSPDVQYKYIESLLNVPGEPPAEAVKMMQDLADQNYPKAMSYVAQDMLMGKDASKGIHLLEKAAGMGDKTAASALISHYDFQSRSSNKPKEKAEFAMKAIQWSEKFPGHQHGCRILLENATGTFDKAVQERAQSLLVNCIEHLAPTRSACDTMKNFLMGSNGLISNLSEQLQNESKTALIHCYERVMRHYNERPVIMGEVKESNEDIINQLKTP